jgi:hypothetical protein
MVTEGHGGGGDDALVGDDVLVEDFVGESDAGEGGAGAETVEGALGAANAEVHLEALDLGGVAFSEPAAFFHRVGKSVEETVGGIGGKGVRSRRWSGLRRGSMGILLSAEDSYRNASSGSTFAARRTGIQHASSPTPTNNAPTTINVAGSLGCTSNRKDLSTRDKTMASATPRERHLRSIESFSEDQLANVALLRAHRAANRQLLASRSHRQRKHAVNSHQRQARFLPPKILSAGSSRRFATPGIRRESAPASSRFQSPPLDPRSAARAPLPRPRCARISRSPYHQML